uniref:Nicotinamide/nicotinic acid mononucleotide adenylyltransferase 2 n=1 Tax=Oryctolagus cuniculus TaxID=9986 RepID=A0A5F9CW47_RABIT
MAGGCHSPFAWSRSEAKISAEPGSGRLASHLWLLRCLWKEPSVLSCQPRGREPPNAGQRRNRLGKASLAASQLRTSQERFSSERARDYLHKTGRFIVIGGIVSPVHDSYGKQGLVSSRHRLVMCQLAVQNSDWIRVDPWECYQDTWQTTCSVLQHHRDLMKRVTGCILSNVSTPSMTPVIGQPQQETPQPAYQNSNVPAKPTAAKILGKVGESLSRICCVRPPVERFTFVDENANLGTVMRYEEIELRILLLCGSDLLESFCIPGLWNEADMEVIVGDFGIVVVPRDAADTDRIMNHSSILRKYRSNILVVKDDVNHPMSAVSSTKSRLALQHGDGHVVDYLSQPVIDYILKSQLYINASG